MSTLANIPATGFVRLSTVLKFIPVSKSTWYAGIAEGRYPKPVHLGPRTSAWRAEDIAALIACLGSQSPDEM